MFDAKKVNDKIKQVELSLNTTPKFDNKKNIHVGVDLGTAYIVIVVLDDMLNPIACDMESSKVVRDGLVIDYLGAVRIVKKLKENIEKRLGLELNKTSIAVPPGTSIADSKTHKYVVEACGFDVTNIVDEPTAANNVLDIVNGVIVDIGGGTTGLSVIKDRTVVYVADEATGGTHLSLVLSGRYKISFDEAEILKKDPIRRKEIFMQVRPVIEKMASIVSKHIKQFEINDVYLVGGTCCLDGIEDVFTSILEIKTHKPENPFFVTPTGIAMCR